MANKKIWLGMLAMALVFGMTVVGCDDGSTGGGGKIDYTANGIEDLTVWLKNQPANGATSPYTIKLKVNDLTDFGLLREALNEAGRYVYLDLSGSALTTIPSGAFCGFYYTYNTYKSCVALTGITIPDSVTIIGDGAFRDCTSLTSITIPNSVTIIRSMAFNICRSLTSVTFQGKITPDNFFPDAFDGDLQQKYLVSGVGTYKTTNPGDYAVWNKWDVVWTKQ